MLLAILLLSACNDPADAIPGSDEDTTEIPRTGTRPAVEAVDSATDTGSGVTGDTHTGSTTTFDAEWDCADKADNDKDGLVDCEDPDCEITPDCASEICDDGLDNEGDGLIDCEDEDCAKEELCLVPCADEILTGTPPFMHTGTTGGMVNDSTPSCTYSNSPDVALAFTAPVDGNYAFDTDGTGWDTALYLYNGCGGGELTCNDDAIGLQSRVTASMTAGQTVIIVVDGYGTNGGNYRLNVTN